MMEEENKPEIGREKKVLDFFKRKFNWFVYAVMAIILWINIKIRTLPMKINPSTGVPFLWDITRNNWTLGPDLDPFFFLRWAKTIVEQGVLPLIDTMRYVPVGYETLNSTTLLPHMIASLYKFLHFFSDKITVEYAAVIFPVIASIFTTIAFFLLVKQIFQNKGKKVSSIISLIATAFLVTLPSLLSRTIAGIPEKESIAFGLMFFAFYLFLSAWKSEKTWKALTLGILAGLFTALMGLIWGGVIFVFTTIAITGFLAFVLGKIDKNKIIVYSGWIISSMIFWIPFTSRTNLYTFFTSSTTGAALIVWSFIIIYFALFETKLQKIKILQNRKIPKTILTIFISLLILFILSSIFIGPKVLVNIGGNVITQLSNPYSDRLAFTVAENKQPFFSDWKGSFGPLVQNIPIFFWLFFVGSIFLFYEMIRKLNKGKIILTTSYVFFLLAIVFSRTSSTSVFNGESVLSILFYISGFLILIGSLCYVYYKNDEKEVFKNIKFEYLFIFSLIFVGIIAGRSGIRLIMMLAPVAVIPLSYLAFLAGKGIMKKREGLAKIFFIIFAILILISVSYTLFYNYKVSEITAENHIPTAYTYQWQNAMAWVRENTLKEAVFGSWWDYGYWIQTMGERATMLDGGNSISYWNYLMGRYVLTANNESEALGLLYNHNVTHFLIDSTDIGKYPAYSNIGSDEDYDKYSWIGTFILDGAQTQETSTKITNIYVGGVSLDADLIIDDGKELLPKSVAGVGALVVSITNKGELEQPFAIMVYEGKQYQIKLRYLFYNEEIIDFGSGIEGGMYIIPSLIETGQGIQISSYGAAMYLSPKNMGALWVRMYLLEEGENFELVHSEPNNVVNELRNQGLTIPDIIYFQGVRGPIKIWKVNYTGNEKYNEEYLQRNYPERLIGRRTK